MPVVVAAILVVLASVALIPVSLVLRFRMGTARRRARGWVAAVNLCAVAVSAALFLAGALAASRWVADAPAYTLVGLAAGAILGLAGTVLTTWEYRAGRLEYTPNRWLVLTVTGVVAARVLYGFWRSWQAWQGGVESTAWIEAWCSFGAPLRRPERLVRSLLGWP